MKEETTQMPPVSSSMRAVILSDSVRFESAHPAPDVPSGWALIRVQKAGICKTDLELMRGYKNFSGVLGHEFVGTVVRCADETWMGRRVVGEINVGCGLCAWCGSGLPAHCPARRVLGIHNLDGCMADYCLLPVANLHAVAESIADDRVLFCEPLAAACEILEQVSLSGGERALVLGDGRLGILCAWVLTTVLANVTLVGRHPGKLALAGWRHLKMALAPEVKSGADLVVEATGSALGMQQAMDLCRARGIIVLKSTMAGEAGPNLSPLVSREQTVIGSRCGPFPRALGMLEAFPDLPLARLITARYPLEQAERALNRAADRDMVKVVLEIS